MFNLDDWLDVFAVGFWLLVLCLIFLLVGCGPSSTESPLIRRDSVSISAEPELEEPLDRAIEAINTAAGRAVVSKGFKQDGSGVWLRSVSEMPPEVKAQMREREAITACAVYVGDGRIYMLDEDSGCLGFLLPNLVHEIGHALGLEHSIFPTSIMYEYSRDWNVDRAAESLAAELDARDERDRGAR